MKRLLLSFFASVAAAAGAATLAWPLTTLELASRDGDGVQMPWGSRSPSLSHNGRWLAFTVRRTHSGERPYGVFVKDLRLGTLTDVALAIDGTPVSGDHPSISADGRFVAFDSQSDQLVPGDDNGSFDVFVRDLADGSISRVSVAEGGTQAAFSSFLPAISADGRRVAFVSAASDLVPDDDNGMVDVFVKDLPSGRIWRVSVNAAGEGSANGNNRAPAISADGRYVAFYTIDSRLVAGDTNAAYDVFVADVEAGTLQRVSVAADGTQAERDCISPALSADGMLVAFHSEATNLVPGDVNGYPDVFVTDLRSGAIDIASRRKDGRVARGGYSTEAALSADGRFVVFESRADNLVRDTANGKPAVFLKDLQTGAIRRVSMSAQGAQANRQSGAGALSGNGLVFSFESDATNLVDDDLNGATTDVFVGPSRSR